MYTSPVEQGHDLSRPIASILRACIVGSRLSCAALACLLLLGAAPSDAQPAVRQVLVLQSFDRGNVVGGPVHRQLPRRTGPARRGARERRPGRRGSNRVCRRARTSGGRLHPIHLRRSSQAGPDCDGRRPRRGLRAQVSTAALSRHADSCSRPSISGISATPRLGTTRPLSRSSTTIRASSRTSCSCCPRPGRCSW